VPFARGGGNEPQNLLTTCWSCNFGRGNALIEEIGLIDPRLRAPILDGWDGLTRILTHGANASAPTRNVAKLSISRGNDASNSATPSSVADAALSQKAWFEELDLAQEACSSRLLTFLKGCEDLQVYWKLNRVLRVCMNSNDGPLSVIGVDPSGSIDIPWHIGGYKEDFRAFAETVAEAIDDAVAYETPKMWRVRKAGRRLTILELLDVAPVLRGAFERLGLALRS
jgi:hypothetical protein